MLATGSERASTTCPRYVRAHTYDWLHVRQALYRRAGFEAVRWHDELLRDLEDLPAVDVPAGVTLLPWDSDRDEELRQVRNEAFADHWGSMVVEPELWHDFTHGHGSRTDLSVIAVDATGAVIGLCLNQAYPEDEAVTGRRDAWIANIGTLRSARGRGVATAMLGVVAGRLRRRRLHPRHARRGHRQPHWRGTPLPQPRVRSAPPVDHLPDRGRPLTGPMRRRGLHSSPMTPGLGRRLDRDDGRSTPWRRRTR